MAVRSIYLPEPLIQDGCIHVDGEEHHHLAVARVETGEAIEIFDGKGNVWTAVVESSGKRETLARVKESRKVAQDPREVILALAIIRIGAFELALEKAVEIGIRRIVPFTASRSNLAPGHRHDRWLRILIEAAKQSKHYYVPALDEPKTFEQVLSLPAASRIVFAESGGGPLKPALRGSPVLYLIGPEGGWSDRELAAARGAGFDPVSLGPSILKAETAAIVGAALIFYEMGK
jgi:16S rRNA (uracil1498-N3)-methyltransferase